MRLLTIVLLAAGMGQEFVRVSPRDGRYLELTDGRPYIPVGLNRIGGADFGKWASWLNALADRRGNYIRVWLSNGLWAVEHEREGLYDEEKARRIDAMLELCRKRGVRVKMTMEHFRPVGGGRQAWADEPLHHVSNGGTAPDLAGFFNLPAPRAKFIKKIRWYQERFGDRPEIYGWELCVAPFRPVRAGGGRGGSGGGAVRAVDGAARAAADLPIEGPADDDAVAAGPAGGRRGGGGDGEGGGQKGAGVRPVG